MSENKNTSFSLLNQVEIDTLVKFLTDQKNSVDSDVMSQNSIDKLIRLIKTDKERMILNPFFSFANIGATAIDKLQFREDVSELCELCCSINEETGFLELSIHNRDKGTTCPLTPSAFDDEDTSEWGYAISPSHFAQIAFCLSIKYTQATYDFVCATYAKLNYGSENHKISECYLPNNTTLLESIL